MTSSPARSTSTTLIRYPLMRGFLAALLTAGLSLIVLTVFDSVVARNLPFVFIVILFTGLFASQLQERMRTLSGSSSAP